MPQATVPNINRRKLHVSYWCSRLRSSKEIKSIQLLTCANQRLRDAVLNNSNINSDLKMQPLSLLNWETEIRWHLSPSTNRTSWRLRDEPKNTRPCFVEVVKRPSGSFIRTGAISQTSTQYSRELVIWLEAPVSMIHNSIKNLPDKRYVVACLRSSSIACSSFQSPSFKPLAPIRFGDVSDGLVKRETFTSNPTLEEFPPFCVKTWFAWAEFDGLLFIDHTATVLMPLPAPFEFPFEKLFPDLWRGLSGHHEDTRYVESNSRRRDLDDHKQSTSLTVLCFRRNSAMMEQLGLQSSRCQSIHQENDQGSLILHLGLKRCRLLREWVEVIGKEVQI